MFFSGLYHLIDRQFYLRSKVSLFDSLFFILSLMESILYLLVLIFYFVKSSKTLAFFNVAIALTIILFLANALLTAFLYQINPGIFYNIGYVGGVLLISYFLIRFTIAINKNKIVKKDDEINEIGLD